jgi:tRNA A64-2'-O-ribosylphosphate transferase
LLLPQGCLPTQAAAVQRLGAGIYLLGSTGLAVGSAAAAAAPAVWQLVDAVLHVGTLPLAGMQGEPQPGSLLPKQQQQQQRQRQEQDQTGQAVKQEEERAPPHACRYCWLPARSSKVERRSLQRQLAPALRFAGAQLALGRRLLLSCDDGLDASVCVAVACLLAFYRLDVQPGSSGAASPMLALPPSSRPSSSDDGSSPPLFPPLLGAAGFTKLSVRQHLAAVSAHYPAARPTRASLRQVYNFFLTQLEGDGGSRSSEPDA